MAVKINYTPELDGSGNILFTETDDPVGGLFPINQVKASYVIAPSLTDNSVLSGDILIERNTTSDDSLEITTDNTYGEVSNYKMNIFNRDVGTKVNTKTYANDFGYGFSYGVINTNSSFNSIAVGGLVISNLPEYITKVIELPNEGLPYSRKCRIYFDSNYSNLSRVQEWYFYEGNTEYTLTGADSEGPYIDIIMPTNGNINVFVNNLTESKNPSRNINAWYTPSTITEYISKNSAYVRDIITTAILVRHKPRESVVPIFTQLEDTFKLSWMNDGHGDYNLSIKNGNVEIYNENISSDEGLITVELPNYYLIGDSNNKITFTIKLLRNTTSEIESIIYAYEESPLPITNSVLTCNFYIENEVVYTKNTIPLPNPVIEISDTIYQDTKKITVSLPDDRISEYTTLNYNITEDITGITLENGKYELNYTNDPGNYTITTKFNYNRVINNKIISAVSSSSKSFSLVKLKTPSMSYTRTNYNVMSVNISEYDKMADGTYQIKVYLDGIEKISNTTSGLLDSFSDTIDSISIGSHNLQCRIIYTRNEKYNSDYITISIPSSVFKKLDTPILSLYNRNTEILPLYNYSGVNIGSITRKSNRIYQFTSVNYATSYDLHLVDNSGKDEVLVPFSEMTRVNTQYQFTLPENKIPDGGYELYIEAKVDDTTYNSIPDNKVIGTKYQILQPTIANSVGSSIVSISENANNPTEISTYKRYIKGVISSSSMIQNFSIQIDGTVSINMYDFLLNKTNPDEITVSFYEYCEYEENALSSSNSTPIIYKLIKLQPVNNLDVDTINKRITFSSVPYASLYRYSIRQNGVILESNDITTTEITYTTELDSTYIGEFIVKSVREIPTENPYYINSDDSVKTTADLEKFLGENIVRNGSILSWDYPKQVSGFNIYKNNLFWKNILYPNTSVDMSELSVGTYTIQIEAYINSSTGAFVSEKYTHPQFTITKLDTPVISFTGNTSNLSWQSISNADYYDIYLNNTLYQREITSSITITSDEVGEYNTTVIAKSNDPFLYRDSNSSNTVIYSVVKLDTPSNIVLHEKDDSYLKTTLTWDSVENATGYIYTLKNITGNITTNYFGINDDDIQLQNTFTLQAINSNRTDSSNPRYLDSDIITSRFGKLPTPILELNGNTVIWKMYNDENELVDYEGADYFEIFDTNITDKDGNYTPIISTPYKSYVLSSTDEKTFNIYVRALSYTSTLLSSEISQPIVHTIHKVKLLNGDLKFDLSFNEITNILSWPDKSQFIGADYFEVYINDELELSLTDSSMDLTRYIKESGGYYTIYVIAKSYKINYIPSEKSYSFNKFINVSYQYGCRVNHKFYKIITPFGFKTCASEEKDTGKICFYSDDKTEIKAYTPISILIYTNAITEGEPFISYDMLVMKDLVSEIQQGNSCVYIHNVDTIELTKELETKYINGLTITQSLSAIQSMYTGLCECQIGMNSNTYIMPEMRGININANSNLKWYEILNFILTAGSFSAELITDNIQRSLYNNEYIVESKIISPTVIEADAVYSEGAPVLQLKGNYRYGETIALPYASMKTEHITLDLTLFMAAIKGATLVAGALGSLMTLWDDLIRIQYTSRQLGNGKRNYYLIPHTELTQEELYSADIWSLKPVWYQSFDNNTEQNYLKITKDKFKPGVYDLICTINTYDNIGAMVKKVNIESGNRSAPFRLMYRNINIQDETVIDNNYGLTITEGIQKVLNKLTPRIVRNSETALPEYSLNSSGIPANLSCPEFTFDKNKSLWEILLDMGRTFNGIPRLNRNKVISFDILSNMVSDDNPIEITNEKEEIESSMDNYASGFISDVSNMNTEHSEWYPSKDGWTTARSTNPLDAVVNKTNMGLVLPNKINYIEEFWVKVPNQKEMEISSYVKEKTVYNALNNNKDGKGSAIYYQQGNNCIYGFGAVSENDQLHEILGLSGNNYAISNILTKKNLIGDSTIDKLITNIANFKYRVKYKPLIDANVITEKSNLSDIPNDVIMNFNQDASTISDTNFGKSSQVQLSRIGNNDIRKAYRTKNFSRRHLLGECMIVNDKRYYADSVSYMFRNTYVDSIVNYSKDFNKINPRIGVSSEYRMWDIPNKNIINRTIHVNNYCYISKNPYTDIQQSDLSLENNKPKLLNEIKQNYLGKLNERKSFFYMTSLNENYAPIYSDTYGILIPSAYSVMGPNIAYTGSCLDYLSAGIKTTDTLYDAIIKDSRYVQKDVLYTTDNGELPAIKLSLCKPNVDELIDTKISGYSFERYFPQVAYKSDDESLTGSVFNLKFNIDKDRREKLQFTYQLHFQTYDKNLNLLHKGLTSHLYEDNITNTPIKKAPVWYGFNKPIRLLETIEPSEGKYIGMSVSDIEYEGLDRTLTKNETKYGFKLDALPIEGEYKTVALIWPNTGEILLDYTFGENDDKTHTPELYFNLSDTKITNKTE